MKLNTGHRVKLFSVCFTVNIHTNFVDIISFGTYLHNDIRPKYYY